MFPEEIRTARLTLRPPAETDMPALVAGIGNFNVSRMLTRVPYPYGPADARWWLGHAAAGRAAGTDHAYLMDLDGGAIGCVALDGLGGAPHLGYWLAEPYWGRGFASEAARALIRAGFAATDLDRLLSSVFADNPASLRVQTKLGFTVTGRGTIGCLARGSEVAHIHTALTRADFEKLDR